MAKYIEITMASGTKYFLISTEEVKYNRQKMNYILRGADEASIEVFTENDITSDSIFINPRRIESFKVFY